MQPRITNPALTVPDALPALQKLGAAAKQAGVPDTTLYLIHLRASQINGCSVCLDLHSRELKSAGEPDERIFTVAPLAGVTVLHRRRAGCARADRGRHKTC